MYDRITEGQSLDNRKNWSLKGKELADAYSALLNATVVGYVKADLEALRKIRGSPFCEGDCKEGEVCELTVKVESEFKNVRWKTNKDNEIEYETDASEIGGWVESLSRPLKNYPQVFGLALGKT